MMVEVLLWIIFLFSPQGDPTTAFKYTLEKQPSFIQGINACSLAILSNFMPIGLSKQSFQCEAPSEGIKMESPGL